MWVIDIRHWLDENLVDAGLPQLKLTLPEDYFDTPGVPRLYHHQLILTESADRQVRDPYAMW